MDVFYYWKDFDKDMKANRIGWLASDRKKMGEMRAAYPDHIWAFRTPAGRKGEVELIACMKWTDTPTVAVPRIDAQSVIFYDPNHEESRRFLDTDTEERIKEISSLIRSEFPQAFGANFRGDNGVQPMRGDFLLRLRKIAQTYPSQPFVDGA